MEYRQQENITQFLMGLNESLLEIRVQMLMIYPLPTVSTAFILIIQEVPQRSIGARPIVATYSLAFSIM